MSSCQNCSYASVQGMIVDMTPARAADGRADSCILYFTVEDENGNVVNFMVTPLTYVVDCKPLGVGMSCTFWYRTDVPTLLIYPPQYTAVVAAPQRPDRMVDVSYYDAALVNEERTLQLHMDRSVTLRTTNNQYFQGSPANHNLVVIYTNSTRSIPAQTTPESIVVLCDELQQE